MFWGMEVEGGGSVAVVDGVFGSCGSGVRRMTGGDGVFMVRGGASSIVGIWVGDGVFGGMEVG